MREKWRKIEGYPDYAVSSEGRVRSRRGRGGREKILKMGVSRGCPYGNVRLFERGDSQRGKIHAVHKLVARAFLPPPEDDTLVVDHLNGVKTDNRAENLEWVTNGENVRRARDRRAF